VWRSQRSKGDVLGGSSFGCMLYASNVPFPLLVLSGFGSVWPTLEWHRVMRSLWVLFSSLYFSVATVTLTNGP
jgi:hypothetical protein